MKYTYYATITDVTDGDTIHAVYWEGHGAIPDAAQKGGAS